MTSLLITSSRIRQWVIVLATLHLCSTTPQNEKVAIPFLEEQAVGTEVHDLKKDILADKRAGISFKMIKQYMTSGSEIIDADTEWVALDEQSGVITVKKPVDRERDCNGDSSQQCIVFVKIVRKPQREFLLIDLELDVIDVNDHDPVFPVMPIINVNVSESAPVNTRINLDRYLATDGDIGPNANIYYVLSRNDYFSVHTFNDVTGAPHLQLVVTDELDHEKKASYDLTLTATDRGTPDQNSGSVTLRVSIVDANDNSPVFDQQTYSLNLEENLEPGRTITTVHARDADSKRFGEIRYFVPVSGNAEAARRLVTIDAQTGTVRLQESLDREKHDNIRIVIAAQDLGGANRNIGKTILEIRVNDQNDNSPVIQISVIVDSNQNTAYLTESATIGTYVAQVTADDADYGENGAVSIHITSHVIPPGGMGDVARSGSATMDATADDEDINEYFVLEEGGFIATGKRLDREVYPEFWINIVACDRASPPMCSSKNLTIQLLDENDNNPEFQNPIKVVSLREDTDLGTLVATVTATDRDSIFKPSLRRTEAETIEPSLNGDIRYQLYGGAGCFTIDEVTGKIRLVGTLDYEKKTIWKLIVTAKDMGEQSLSANSSLDVKVVDVNDNPPVFSNPAVTNQTVPATIRSGDVIAKINAIDYDEGSHSDVRYSIVSEDGSKEPPCKFILDRFNGDLRLNMSNSDLQDMIGTHSIVLKAQDLGSPPLQGFTTLRVEVYDVPLASLPSFTVKSEEPAAASGDLTVILIASLASATILLVLVLTGVVVKCKRENKEIRTYNCRTAESKKGWQLSSSRGTLPSDVIVTSSNHLMASRDSNLNSVDWNQSAETKLTYDSKHIIQSHTNSMSNISQRTMERKGNSFVKDQRHHSQHPITSQVDGDSGRGDSDHDTGSCEDKESLPHEKNRHRNEQYQESPGDVVVTEIPEGDSMGPLCTHICRQYGHSDACWMHVLDNQMQGNYYLPADPRPTTPVYNNYQVVYGNDRVPISGLETICETQPLHSVLGVEEYDEDQIENYSQYQDQQALESQVAFLNQSGSEYYPYAQTVPYPPSSAYWNHSQSAIPVMSGRSTPMTSPRQYPVEDSPMMSSNKRHSASDLFHDGLVSCVTPATQSSYYQPNVTPTSSPRNDNVDYVTNSRSESPASFNASKRRSTTSLHGELLHRRFLAAANGTSRADDVHVTSGSTAEYGAVSMQETQQIIDDIDQLIDH